LDIQQINVFGGLPFIYNAFADFAALIATGWVLQHMSTGTMRRLVITFVVFACGILALSFMALDIAVIMLKYILLGVTPSTLEEWIFNPSRFVAAVLFPFYRSDPSEWRVDTLYGVFVWSTLMGILWLAVFSASVFIANVIMK
jgi:hypothetical protein